MDLVYAIHSSILVYKLRIGYNIRSIGKWPVAPVRQRVSLYSPSVSVQITRDYIDLRADKRQLQRCQYDHSHIRSLLHRRLENKALITI